MASRPRLSILKCFSILVAAGKGHRCHALRSELRSTLLARDEISGEVKVLILKAALHERTEAFDRICRELGRRAAYLLADVDRCFFDPPRPDPKEAN